MFCLKFIILSWKNIIFVWVFSYFFKKKKIDKKLFCQVEGANWKIKGEKLIWWKNKTKNLKWKDKSIQIIFSTQDDNFFNENER